MKYANYHVDYMVYASLLGKSLFVTFGKSFLGFRKIFTPAYILLSRIMSVSPYRLSLVHFSIPPSPYDLDTGTAGHWDTWKMGGLWVPQQFSRDI